MGRPDQRGQFLHQQEPVERELEELFEYAYDIPLPLKKLPYPAFGNIGEIADHSLFVAETRVAVADSVGPDFADVDSLPTLVLNSDDESIPIQVGHVSSQIVWSRSKNGMVTGDYLSWTMADDTSYPYRSPVDGFITCLVLSYSGSMSSSSDIQILVNGSSVKTLKFTSGQVRIVWKGAIPISFGQSVRPSLTVGGSDTLNSPSLAMWITHQTR